MFLARYAIATIMNGSIICQSANVEQTKKKLLSTLKNATEHPFDS
jgi:hypothetical protein|tara:strand:+ start:857 stop:991 length:135 start_codon:yes stop_codon:yes gene_type:complete